MQKVEESVSHFSLLAPEHDMMQARHSGSYLDHPCTWLKKCAVRVEGVASTVQQCAGCVWCDVTGGIVQIFKCSCIQSFYIAVTVTVFSPQLHLSCLSRANLRYFSISPFIHLDSHAVPFYLANPVSFFLLKDITLWEHCATVILKQKKKNCKWDRAEVSVNRSRMNWKARTFSTQPSP